MKKKRLKRILILLSTFILLLIGYITFTAISIVNYGKTDQTRQADAAIVLGASVWDSEPSPVFAARIDHSIWLYQKGYVKKLIFTGGVGEGNITSEAQIAKEYAMRKGVPEEDILLEEQSKITQENLQYAAEIVKEQNIDTVLVVSDPLHMKRALLMAKDFALNAYSSPTPTTMYQTFQTQIPFLARETFFYIGYCIYTVFL